MAGLRQEPWRMSISGSPWQDLRLGGRGKDPAMGIPVITMMHLETGDIHYALWPEDEACLLIPLPRDEPFPELNHGDALELTEFHVNHVRYLALTCTARILEDVFSRFADTLLHRIQKGSPATFALKATIDEFRRLLSISPENATGRNEVVGLLGEMTVLEQILPCFPHACRIWTGPSGANHDFSGSGCSVEVKTSVPETSQTVHASSFQQMVPPDCGPLYLCHVSLREPGTLNISAMARRIVAMLEDTVPFRDRLAEAGCRDPDAREWNRWSFEVAALEIHEVTASFPCITPAQFRTGKIPVGIVDEGYGIDLGKAHAYRMRHEDHAAVWRALGGDNR